MFCFVIRQLKCFVFSQKSLSVCLLFHAIIKYLFFLNLSYSRICVSRLQTAEYIRAHVRRGGEGDRMRENDT